MRQKGFTLIEMLVALSIFSSVMGLALYAYEQGRSTWARSLARGADELRLIQREQWLRLTFEQSVAAPFRDTRTFSSFPYFYGNSRQVSFLSAAPIFQGPGKVAVVELKAEQRDKRWTLYYREQLGADPQRGIYLSDVDWFPLLTDLNSVEFVYEADIHMPFSGSLGDLEQNKRRYYRDRPDWINYFESNFEEGIPRRVMIRFVNKEGLLFEWFFSLARYSDVLEPVYRPWDKNQ
ncbi:PulJ/GspJ family protein [Motilimonas pumila]|uniref:Type II secretion system protein n=1 Tax=Motilimonas pumila TaxID=2303987 RepID=A0A418YDZ5_9GAMM|nr:type II secretion system protein [Motilimonas pumila]RJG42728.1 type II secretion system protein [Motilimonas pumila]